MMRPATWAIIHPPGAPKRVDIGIDRFCGGVADAVARGAPHAALLSAIADEVRCSADEERQTNPAAFRNAIPARHAKSVVAGVKLSHRLYSLLTTQTPLHDDLVRAICGPAVALYLYLLNDFSGADARPILDRYLLLSTRLFESGATADAVFARSYFEYRGKPIGWDDLRIRATPDGVIPKIEARSLSGQWFRAYCLLLLELARVGPGTELDTSAAGMESGSRPIDPLHIWKTPETEFGLILLPPPRLGPEDPVRPIIGGSVDTPKYKVAPPMSMSLAEAQTRFTAGATHNLPNSTTRLTSFEIAALRDWLDAEEQAGFKRWPSEAIALIRSVLDVGEPTLQRSRTIKIALPANPFTPNEVQAPFYVAPMASITLLLNAAGMELPGPLTAEHFVKAMECLEQLRRATGGRQTPSRVARVFLGAVLDLSQDRSLQTKLDTSLPEVWAGAGESGANYYSSFDLSTTQKVFSPMGLRLGGLESIAPDARIGSRGFPNKAQLRDAIDRAKALVRRGVQPGTTGWIAFHNRYACWMGLQNLVGQLARFSRDPCSMRAALIASPTMTLATDKGSSPSHECRFVPLPDMCHKQRALYDQHLAALLPKLKLAGMAIAKSVAALLGGDPIIPYLFLINETTGAIEPLTFKAMTKIFAPWPWHIAAHRHFMAGELRDRGVAAEAIELAFGHWSDSEWPMGPDSLLLPKRVMSGLSADVNEVLIDLGFEALPGLPRQPPPRADRSAELAMPSGRPFGLAWRKRRRKDPERSAERIANQAWAEALDFVRYAHETRDVPDAAVDRALKTLMRKAIRKPFLLPLLLRQLRVLTLKLRDDGVKVKVPGLAYMGSPTRPLFDDMSGLAWAQSETMVEALTEHIESNCKTLARDAKTGASTALLWSILCGGLTDAKAWPAFVNALSDGYYRFCRTDWLMLAVGNDKQRFIGDSMSRLLIARAVRNVRGERLDSKAVIKDALALANDLASTSVTRMRICAQRLDEKHSKIAPITVATLQALANARLTAHTSGAARSILRGRQSAKCLDDFAFARALSHDAIQYPNVAEEAELDPFDTIAQKSPPQASRAPDIEPSAALARAEAHIAELRQIFREERRESTDKSELARQKRKRLLLALRAFGKRIKATGTAPLVSLLLQFYLHLLRHKHIRKKLQVSSIESYFGALIDPLFEAFGLDDPCALDEDVRQDIYLDILGPKDYGCLTPEKERNARKVRALHLRFFDRYVAKISDGDCANWAEIEPDLPASKVDANVITPTEMAAIFQEIRNSTALAPDLQAALLRIAYGMVLFGLRFGEAYRLRKCDFQGQGREQLCVVKPTRRGNVKSTDRTRIVACLGRLIGLVPESLAVELEALVSGSFDLGPDHQRYIDNKRKLQSELGRIIRKVTGNKKGRPHQIRHTVGSYAVLVAADLAHPLVMAITGHSNPEDYSRDAAALRWALTRRTSATKSMLLALALMLGHRDVATTLANYFHFPEVLAAAELDCSSIKFSSKVMSTLGGVKPSAESMRASRRDESVWAASPVALSLASARREDVTPLDVPAFVRTHIATATAARRTPVTIRTLVRGLHDLLKEHSITDVAARSGLHANALIAAVTKLREIGLFFRSDVLFLSSASVDASTDRLIWNDSTHLSVALLEIERLLNLIAHPRCPAWVAGWFNASPASESAHSLAIHSGRSAPNAAAPDSAKRRNRFLAFPIKNLLVCFEPTNDRWLLRSADALERAMSLLCQMGVPPDVLKIESINVALMGPARQASGTSHPRNSLHSLSLLHPTKTLTSRTVQLLLLLTHATSKSDR